MAELSTEEKLGEALQLGDRRSSLSDFELLGKVGEGSYSAVWKVRRRQDSRVYALKRIKIGTLDEKDKKNSLNEVRILASLRHQNIVTYRDAFFDERAKEFCIVTDYADGGDLFEYIKSVTKMKASFKEDVVWVYLKQILAALRYLHGKKVVHRDLKGANILLSRDKRKVQVGDLNVSKIAKNSLLYTQTGTPYYASPEVWRDEPYDHKSDIWSLGCLVYEMAALKPPFLGQSMQELNAAVQRGLFPRLPKKYSDQLQQVVALMLKVNPRDRPDAAHLCQLAEELRPQTEEAGELDEQVELDGEADDPLLNTILLPKDLKLLEKNLPRANYDSKARPRILESLVAEDRTPKPRGKPREAKSNYRSEAGLPPLGIFAKDVPHERPAAPSRLLSGAPNGPVGKQLQVRDARQAAVGLEALPSDLPLQEKLRLLNEIHRADRQPGLVTPTPARKEPSSGLFPQVRKVESGKSKSSVIDSSFA